MSRKYWWILSVTLAAAPAGASGPPPADLASETASAYAAKREALLEAAFELYRDEHEGVARHWLRLKVGNGTILLVSGPFSTLGEAERMTSRIVDAASDAPEFRSTTHNDMWPAYIMHDARGEVLGKSGPFGTLASRERAIERFAHRARTASVRYLSRYRTSWLDVGRGADGRWFAALRSRTGSPVVRADGLRTRAAAERRTRVIRSRAGLSDAFRLVVGDEAFHHELTSRSAKPIARTADVSSAAAADAARERSIRAALALPPEAKLGPPL